MRIFIILAVFLVTSPVLAQEADADAPETSETSETSETAADETSDEADDGGSAHGSDAAAQAEAEKAAWAGLAYRVALFRPAGRAFLVAAPQEDAPVVAVAELRRQLDEAGASLVIDDSALGITPKSPDADVVAAARNQPVEVVIVVRFYGELPTMVASGYDLNGEPVSNFSLNRGEVAPPKTSLAIADAGDVEADAKAAADIEPVTSAEALETYDQQRWTLELLEGSDIVVRHGATGEELEGDAALEALGQPGLAQEWRDTMGTKRILYWTGAGIAGVGLVTTLIGFFTIPGAFADDQEIPKLNVGLVVGGFGGIFLGILSVVVGHNIDALKVSRDQARKWVDDKNADLREELSIPVHLSWQVTPVRKGAVAGLTLRF